MKFIPYKAFKDAETDIDTIGLMIIHLNTPTGGANLDEMIERYDLRQKLEALKKGAPRGVILDKDEYALIKDMPMRKWPWTVNAAVIEILTDVRDARAPVADEVATKSPETVG